MNIRTALATTLAVVALADSAEAQCAFGQQPRAGGSCDAPVAVKLDLPTDPKKWIVAPFTNTTRSADLDWLSDASVGLLSTDMSRWTDIRVIDAERVTDLLKIVPASQRNALGLAAALDMAKRAGAGMLVMGEYLKTGTRTTITARVFDVKTGTRIRTINEVAGGTDDIPSAYQKLAPKVLDAPKPANTTLGGVGTNSVEALRAYTLGHQAKARWRDDSAQMFFARAVALDSTFALAELGRRNYAAAIQYSANLPERERTLIALAQPDVPRSVRCSAADKLLAADSADAEGWKHRGWCLLTGTSQSPLARLRVTVGPDGVARPNASPEQARKAMERSLALQPSDDAMLWRQNLTNIPDVVACAVDATPCPLSQQYIAARVFDHDTLALTFERLNPIDRPEQRQSTFAGRRAKQIADRDFMARWVASSPRDLGGHAYYGITTLLLGDLSVAQRELRLAQEMVHGGYEYNRALVHQMRGETELRMGNGAAAAVQIDSAITNPVAQRYEIAAGMIERSSRDTDSARAAGTRAYFAVWTGVFRPDVYEFVKARTDSVAFRAGRANWIHTLTFHTLRTRPAADTAHLFSLVRFQAFLALGDTVRARKELAEYDEWGATRAEDVWVGYEMFAAESRLQLGDTAGAWAKIAPLARRMPGIDFNGLSNDFTRTIGRALLLYADVAAMNGRTAEARSGYRLIAGFWSKADPAYAPVLARIKAARAKLGP